MSSRPLPSGAPVVIQASTRLIALLGYPVAHSRSPLIHNTAFAAQQLDLAYVACPVRPADLSHAVAGLRSLQFLGANVTIPHKQAILPYLDELTPQARAVGAVNTLVHREAEALLVGDNTDMAGFLLPLAALDLPLTGASMVLFGAGGAARAVVYAMLTAFRPRRLTIAARDMNRAERLARDLAAHDAAGGLDVVAWDEAGPAVRASRLLVNATPIGMYPHVEASVWPHPTDYTPDHVLYDLVYNPVQTAWLREGAARGAAVVSGLEMFIGQAAAAYTQWTNRPMPLDLVRDVLGR